MLRFFYLYALKQGYAYLLNLYPVNHIFFSGKKQTKAVGFLINQKELLNNFKGAFYFIIEA
jgi:hypothetical protein